MHQLWGNAVALGAILRILARLQPRPTSTEQRLAMLPRSVPAASAVTIHWDEHQIPFIEAASDTDLAAALGVVHAHLRLGQIELMRRVALGRLSEMIGPRGIELDRTLRLFGFSRAAPGIVAMLPEPTRRWAEAFLAGFNHCVAQLAHAGALPHEFAVLGIRPEPWTLADLFTVARLVSADVNWMVFGRLLRARAAMSAEEWQRLWPLLLEGAGAETWTETPAPEPGEALTEQALARSARSNSNSAAVAGRRSANGTAMIASDPHLPIMLPNLWLIAGLHSPTMNAVGLMLPGLPFVALGRNRWIAWGGTNLHAASSELFDVSGEHLTDQWETIRVRGARPHRIRLRESRLGPVVSDGLLLRSARPLALRWVGHRPSDELSAMLGIARARDWQEFRRALSGFAIPGQNMVYADATGPIGRVIAAALPRRPRDTPPDLVADPRREAEWTELVGSRELPAERDPSEGFVASANEDPGPTPAPVGFFFSPPERASRMRELLGGEARLTAEDLQRLQQDVCQPAALRLRDLLVRGVGHGKRAESLRRLLQALAEWDGCYAADSRGAAAFELVFAHLAALLWPERRIAAIRAIWTTRQILGRDIAALTAAELERALSRALAAAARRFRREPSWGALHRLRLRHPLAQLPLLGRRFTFGEFASAGGNDTLNKTGFPLSRGRHYIGYGACARHISDLADPDDNRFVLLGGQDGWFGSANFLDQVATWRRGGYITVPLRIETARLCFRHKTLLEPAGSPQ